MHGERSESTTSNLRTIQRRSKEILSSWWSGYTDGAKNQIDDADYPAWVESYLVAMLAGRLQLPLPDWYTDTSRDDDEVMNTLKLIAGAKATGDAVFRSAAAGAANPVAATLPLPDPPTWSPMFDQRRT